MRPTRRGILVLVGLVGLLVWGSLFGIAAYNALVVAGFVSFVMAGLVLRSGADISVRRRPVSPGDPGQPRTVEIEVDHPRSVIARVSDRVPDSVDQVDDPTSLVVQDGSVAYRVSADRRGITSLGPATVRVTDPLGLLATTVRTAADVELVTYPRRHVLPTSTVQAAVLGGDGGMGDRYEFDHLREYQHGDTLRNVDWKSSAKRGNDPLIVSEYRARRDVGPVTMVVDAASGTADAVARAGASLAMAVLDLGIAVGLVTPTDVIDPGHGETQRRQLLTAFARFTTGHPDVPAGATTVVGITGTPSGEIRVSVGESTRPYDQLRASSSTPEAVTP